MDLKDIAAVSGKGGLFKVLKPTRTGVILETIDAQKAKLIANANNRVSLLKEISVYTTSKEASLPLEDVFSNIFKKFGKKISVTSKSADQELHTFLETVVPDYDTERVYTSDIKKIVSWYALLVEFMPEVLEKKEEPVKEEKKAVKPEIKEEKKKEENTEDKPKAKKEEKKAPAKKETEEKPKAKAKTPAKKK
jgi:hypothetical protein